MRQQLLDAIQFVSEQLARDKNWDKVLPPVLAHLGEAAGVDRVALFQAIEEAPGRPGLRHRYEWRIANGQPTDSRLDLSTPAFDTERWRALLSQRQPITGLINEFPESEQEAFLTHDIQSLAAIPIFFRDDWWGLICFLSTQPQEWSEPEIEALNLMGSILGIGLDRRRRVEPQIQTEVPLSFATEVLENMLHELPTLIGASVPEGEINQRAAAAKDSGSFLNFLQVLLEIREMITLVGKQRITAIPTVIPIRDPEAGSIRLLDPAEVACVIRRDRRVFFLIGGKTVSTYDTIERLGDRLAPSGFFRVNPSALVNIRYIEHLISNGDGSYDIILKEIAGNEYHATITASRSRAKELLKALNYNLSA